MTKQIPRLTRAMVLRAERHGKIQGWHELCLRGYLPEEIHVYSPSAWPESEVRFKVREYARLKGLPIPVNCARKRIYTRKAPHVEDPAAAFRANVMRVGMALVLTQPMLEEFCALHEGVESDRSLYFKELGAAAPHNSIAAMHALQKRGLIGCDREITKIGELLIDLLKEAGVFRTADAAIAKKHGAAIPRKYGA